MFKLFTKEGEVTLESDELSSKIATDRKLYVKYPGYKEYKYTGYDVERGLSKRQKEMWLFSHRLKVLERIKNEKTTEKQQKTDTN